jgi:predicted RNA-binding Zn-ribbon protein involved in translation (DUF1610 family)
MRRQSKKPNICPRCGYEVEKPEKTWHIMSPIPDSRGSVKINIMQIYICPKCGYKWRTTISKIKAGEDIEFEGRESEKTEEKPREGKIIEIDLSELDEV